MVESYSKNANHNMRRPVVKEEIVDFMRTRQKRVSGSLEELENFAHAENIPIIPHETVAYFRFLLETLQPEKILEIGTAIGFSALLMAEHAPHAQITTIDRNPEMIALAKANFTKFDKRKQITLLEGDAMDLLPGLKDRYDFVFMDSAKSKYVVFLPEVLRCLASGGLIIIDDVFQGGDVAKEIGEVRRGQRTIYRGLHQLFDKTLDQSEITSALLPLGDGILMIRKK
ncbi:MULTISPECIES: O-methyltransferase [Streptococcus]|uniref:tRNA 5-hydroxyuridine methyltransferase n=2 Tax=Streptococcus intermedius TaxID=1338 RepID=T1ZEY2_STRIT|nr:MULTISPECIES: O-methyltransferase [Streptococcus]AGU76478.1 O-methyltransferase [Streptococcus intermedius B196]MDN5016793.1 O-methyltransferase [Streptococcus sp. SI1]MDP1433016.1 O-methyltransferase [Streptococcus intermedius]PMR65084.1 protein-L-isoaspartate(D-aspartate) O-methyltransferase [Streptococcus intermedius]RSJ18554.1 putative O-methyltransferase [Streptococcus intermedius]